MGRLRKKKPILLPFLYINIVEVFTRHFVDQQWHNIVTINQKHNNRTRKDSLYAYRIGFNSHPFLTIDQKFELPFPVIITHHLNH